MYFSFISSNTLSEHVCLCSIVYHLILCNWRKSEYLTAWCAICRSQIMFTKWEEKKNHYDFSLLSVRTNTWIKNVRQNSSFVFSVNYLVTRHFAFCCSIRRLHRQCSKKKSNHINSVSFLVIKIWLIFCKQNDGIII